jgi:hypothetical protein
MGAEAVPVREVVQLGFAAFVAVYLLVTQGKVLGELTQLVRGQERLLGAVWDELRAIRGLLERGGVRGE